MSESNPVSKARDDLRVLKILVENDGPVTSTTLSAVWRWFLDVEIPLPLPAMPLTDKQRLTLTRAITSEMDDVFAELEQQAETGGNVTEGEPVDRINALWRELAGCYADILNASLPQLPEEQKREMEANAVRLVAMSTGMDEEEAAEHIRTDPVTRTMLRRSGIEPDNVSFS